LDQGAAKKAPSGSILSTSQTDLSAIASARFDVYRGQSTANAPIGGQSTKLTVSLAVSTSGPKKIY